MIVSTERAGEGNPVDFKPIFKCTDLTNGRVGAKASGRGEEELAWFSVILTWPGPAAKAPSRLARGIIQRGVSRVQQRGIFLASYEKTKQPKEGLNSESTSQQFTKFRSKKV